MSDLIVRGGVQVMHAHNAWLDVWLQLGILGLVVFGALIVATLVRSWLMATDRVILSPGSRGSYSWVAMLPLLVLTAQPIVEAARMRIVLRGKWELGALKRLRRELLPDMAVQVFRRGKAAAASEEAPVREQTA